MRKHCGERLVRAHEPGALAGELEAPTARGFRTLKVKAGSPRRSAWGAPAGSNA